MLVTRLQNFYICQQLFHRLFIRTIVKPADAALFVHQDKIFGVDHVVFIPIAIVLNRQVRFSRQFVNLFFIAGNQIPLAVVHPLRARVFFQLRHGVYPGRYRVREQHDLLIVENALLYLPHVVRHNRANGSAGGEEKIGYVNFAPVIFLRNGVPVLVEERKVGYGVVFPHILDGGVHQFCIYHGGLIDGEGGGWFQGAVKERNTNNGKKTKGYGEVFKLFEKKPHAAVT